MLNLTDIKQKLADIAGADKNVAEKEALTERLSELQACQHQLSLVNAKIETLNTAKADCKDKVPIPIKLDVDSFKTMLVPIEQTIEKFEKEQTNQNLMGGQRWKKLTTQIGDQCVDAVMKLEDDWEKFVLEYLGQSPQEIDKNLGKTAANLATLDEYNQIYEDGLSCIDAFTQDNEINIKSLIEEVNKLKKVSNKFRFDIPENVKKFISGSSGFDGFDLEKYTPEIKEWLTENEQLGDYIIRIKH